MTGIHAVIESAEFALDPGRWIPLYRFYLLRTGISKPNWKQSHLFSVYRIGFRCCFFSIHCRANSLSRNIRFCRTQPHDSMYTGLQHLHSYLAYFLLGVLILSLIYAIVQFVTKSMFTERVRKVVLTGFIASHLQLLIGLILYVVSPLGLSGFSGDVMSDSVSRLYALEHPITMIIAVILISVGYIKAKKPGVMMHAVSRQ